MPGLNSPLQCVVEYHGFRVLAVAELSFASDTPEYGSEDGGLTVFDGDVEVKEKMKVPCLAHCRFLCPVLVRCCNPGSVDCKRFFSNVSVFSGECVCFADWCRLMSISVGHL